MYQVGQKVFYGSHGVCSVLDIETKTVDRKPVRYFALAPLDHPDARYYIPTENPTALAKISPLMERRELEAIFAGTMDQSIWISDENRRKQRYRELISSGDRRSLFAMIYALNQHRKQQEEQGRKFHLCDENFLRDAQKLICSEVAEVMNMSNAEADAYISTWLDK